MKKISPLLLAATLASSIPAVAATCDAAFNAGTGKLQIPCVRMPANNTGPTIARANFTYLGNNRFKLDSADELGVGNISWVADLQVVEGNVPVVLVTIDLSDPCHYTDPIIDYSVADYRIKMNVRFAATSYRYPTGLAACVMSILRLVVPVALNDPLGPTGVYTLDVNGVTRQFDHVSPSDRPR